MFSPTTVTLRAGLIQQVLGLEPSNWPDEGSLDVFDPATLDEYDEGVFYELQELEKHFETYTATPFDTRSVFFVLDSVEPSTSNSFSIISTLSSTDPETRRLLFRLQGLQSLIPCLEAVTSTHIGLISQRNDLLATVNLEIERMLAELWNERKTRITNSLSLLGIRSVSADNRPINPYVSPIVTSAIVLAAVVHTIMRVSRGHCNFVLSSIRAIVSMALRLESDRSAEFLRQHLNDIPTTLPTALYRLNLRPSFDLYACCPKCSRLYPQSTALGQSNLTICSAKNLDGIECGAELITTHHRGTQSWQIPIRRYTHMRFENWVSELLLRPGMEELLEATRPNPNPGAAADDVWDAPYLKTYPDPTQPAFMDGPSTDLRLAMMLNFDFFNPYQNKEAGKKRSVGCFFMICLNLPPDIRHNPSYAYLVAVVPGPTEAKLDEINSFIKPIVDDMMEMNAPGIWVSRTHKYPRGRRVRAGIAINSMDIPAARALGGFASHSHTCFCHLCNAKRAQIDTVTLASFQLRTIVDHRQLVALWDNAKSLDIRQKIYDRYGVRNVDWLRFPWWNPFDSIVVGPMHWTKNILDKQLRKNMNWSWTIPAGLPDDIAPSIPIISELEYNWGTQAFLCLDETAFKNAKLTAPILRYLCVQRGIFEAGLSGSRLIEELNQWRKTFGITTESGNRTAMSIQNWGNGKNIGLLRAHSYVSKHPPATLSTVSQNSLVTDLRTICHQLGLDPTGQKEQLIKRLQLYYQTVRVPNKTEIPPKKKKSSDAPRSLLGFDVLDEVKKDMGRTTLPSWIKHPPINFATVDHGKLQSEEYKSLALISFTVTLVRLWGQETTVSPLRMRLDHFLHLMLAVRILAFQSLTELDIVAFELHYGLYLEPLKKLYPSCTFIPVQHLGLHLPHFMRLFGPSTRWSESTCEYFIGMFQNITTNFKFGDLEQTLHREFVMASRLKGMVESRQFTQPLEQFGEVVQDFLAQAIPSKAQEIWEAKHSSSPTRVNESVHEALGKWSTARSTRAFPTSLFVCTSITLGNVIYAPYESSNGNSCVFFCPPGHATAPLPGRIEYILKEPDHLVASGQPRIVLIVRTFQSLTDDDSACDPYSNHPIIGRSGAGIAQLYYDELVNETHLIEPRDLVSHAAICPYTDSEGLLSRSTIVVLSLDLKHKRFS